MCPTDPRSSQRPPSSGPHSSVERPVERTGQSFGPGYHEGIGRQQSRFEEQFGREFHSQRGDYRYERRAHDEYSQPGGPSHPKHHADYGRQQHINDKKNFSGVGPKGFSVSDDTIREEVCHKLWEHDGIDASELEVEVKEGKVIVTGSLPEREMRDLVEDVCDDFVSKEKIQLQINVRRQLRQR